MKLPEIHYKHGIAFLIPWNIDDTLSLSVYSILGNRDFAYFSQDSVYPAKFHQIPIFEDKCIDISQKDI